MIFESIVPPIDIPGVDIPTHFLASAKANGAAPETPAFVDIGSQATLTYGELDKMHDRIASGLVNNLGIHKGDVVMIFAPNSIFYAPAYFGIIAAGAVCCTASSMYNAPEIAYQLNDCKAKAVFVGKAQGEIVIQAIEQGLVDMPYHNVITFGDIFPGYLYRGLHEILSDEPYNRLRITTKEEAASTLAVIVYSSGTTGRPKGVMLSHYNLTQYILPSYHIDTFLRAIQDFKIQYAVTVPSILAQIVKHPNLGRYDLSSVKSLSCGAASLTKNIEERASWLLPVSVNQGYGLSETSGGITLMTDHMHIPGSVGFMVPNGQVKFVDENGTELGVSQEGELWVRSSQVMMGYLNCPEENAQVFDKDGFLRTGDIGYINETGHIFITDRIKELIKYKGMQVSAIELEDILMTHEAVEDAAVIGVYDHQRETEVPMAYVVLAGNVDRADKCMVPKVCMEIQVFVAAKVAGHKQLRGGVRSIRAIPRNASGKILRRELKTRHAAVTGAKL
ncbi:hypothetical protein FBU59_000059 [Linderina macrospora]|uniref:Uncharacterized protein n=1 Tax=Linderina macrospora TaxID=4868 RepID=A0ACC1JI91_9FUNG|nr:hypothetical protein FBU59_000059 [Linderina macrospora]